LRVSRPAADVRAATIAALEKGASLLTPTYATWDIQGPCIRPINLDQEGYGHLQTSWKGVTAGGATEDQTEWQQNRTLSAMVPCRQCSACLKARMVLWGRRSAAEWERGSALGLRAWFGTLTFGPAARFRFLSQTRARLDRSGCLLEGLNPVDRFAEQHRETGPEVTKYLKRLRKGNEAKKYNSVRFKYMLSVEPHKDWSPHYHLMVHEVSDLMPIRKTALEGHWPHGHVQWRLVKDAKAAFYAAKYLSKFSIARVRASREYGVADKLF
jgi:hypothetical protein